MRTDIDIDMLIKAYTIALESKDPSTQNGAIIISVPEISNNYVAIYDVQCANNFPKGVREIKERFERPLKYEYIEHAERAAIYEAARRGIRTDGATMYCPWFACSDCARGIVSCGIKRVVGHLLPEHENNPRWKDSIAIAMEILEEGGVKCDYIEGKLGCKPIRMNGELVYP